jgi:hypothetical protein
MRSKVVPRNYNINVFFKGEKAEFLIARIARIAQIVNDCSVIAIDCQ